MNLIGDVYGRLTVIAFGGFRGKSPMWQCRCDCGDKSFYYRNNLRSGNSTQCLKCNRAQLAGQKASHGMYGTPTYRTWERVRRTNDHVKRWEKFENFLDDMGKRPSVNHYLIRKDPAKPWRRSNAMWLHKTKARKERADKSGRRLTYRGRTQSVAAWAREIGISPAAFKARLEDPNWSRRETFELGPQR